MNLLSDKSKSQTLVAAINKQHCRVNHFGPDESGLTQLASGEFSYSDLDDLATKLKQWTSKNHCRGLACHWVLNRDLYQTYNTDPPNVLEKELDEAIKWQIKDLIELPINEVLVSHYKPELLDQRDQQLVAIVVSKTLVEKLIEMTTEANLELEIIDIEELTIGHALLSYCEPDRITGFIGEDNSGLVFNFYSNGGLSFSRHKKGKFIPEVQEEEFSLEGQNTPDEDAFLLETQRTLDYVVSQFFRRPVDNLLLQQPTENGAHLVDLIRQITDIPVSPVAARVVQTSKSDSLPLLTEAGSAMRLGAV